MTENYLLKKSSLKFNAIEFDKINPEDFIPALEDAAKEKDANILKITGSLSDPSFENTILKYELSGESLMRIVQAFSIMYYTNATDEFTKLAPEIDEFITKTMSQDILDEKLFDRIEAVYNSRDNLNLDNDDIMLIKRTHEAFVLGGANCPKDKKKKLEDLNVKIGKLCIDFSSNVQKESVEFNFIVENEEDIKNMPQDGKDAARQLAKEKGKEGFLFLPNRSMTPLMMKYCNSRILREDFFKKQRDICYSGKETDNQENVKDISNLRCEIAKIFKKQTYGEMKIEFNLLNQKDAAIGLVNDILAKSLPIAKSEVEEIRNFARNIEGDDFEIEPWDLDYYSEIYKKEKFDFDAKEVKPYFELNRTLDTIFGISEDAYGLSFRKLEGIPSYHKDVIVYEVQKNDKHHGLIYLDLFSRTGVKSDGAWMNEITTQSRTPHIQRPHIQMCTNFTKSKENEPSLLTQDEVETLLHEFGHVLHGLLSDVKYSSLAGTSVPRDFVELPSQVMEPFFFEKSFLDKCAIHYKTGEKLPNELYNKILASKKFMKGFWYARQMGLCMIDQFWNTLEEPFVGSVKEKEIEILENIKLFKNEVLRYTTVVFLHPFGHGYEMNYHSYVYSEILDSGMFNFFKKNNFSKEAFKKFEDEILKKGSTIDYLEAYKKVTGDIPRVETLLERI